MDRKHPTWTRSRVGRDRVHWVAYDGRAGSGDRAIVAQGYASSLVEADAAARDALAEAGLYGGRRTASGRPLSGQAGRTEPRRQAGHPGRSGLREFLYTRRHCDQDGSFHVRAHRVIKKTATKVHVSERSSWTGLMYAEDEAARLVERAIVLDRARLERDGLAYSNRFGHSAFYRSSEEAAGDSAGTERMAFAALGLSPPCTMEDLKAAYRRRALEAHPDRGGSPEGFKAVQDAYRQLARAAQDLS